VLRNREFLTLRQHNGARFFEHRALDSGSGRNERHTLAPGSKVAPVVNPRDVGVPAAERICFRRLYVKNEPDILTRNALP
jgi:hypothetical protein